MLGRALSWGGVGAIGGMLLGASLYGLHDVTFSATGYTWLAVNLVTTSAYQVLVKLVVSSDAAKDMGPFGFSYLNNLLSLPMLALISVAVGEVPAMRAGARHQDSAGAAVLGLSGALGFCLSVSAFKLNTMIAATSMMVANNVNKVGDGGRGRDRGVCAARRPPPLPFFFFSFSSSSCPNCLCSAPWTPWRRRARSSCSCLGGRTRGRGREREREGCCRVCAPALRNRLHRGQETRRPHAPRSHTLHYPCRLCSLASTSPPPPASAHVARAPCSSSGYLILRP